MFDIGYMRVENSEYSHLPHVKLKAYIYRGGNKGLFVLVSRTQAGPGRTVKQVQEEISRNHVQPF